jgi:MSHA biogenesis protein MshL
VESLPTQRYLYWMRRNAFIAAITFLSLTGCSTIASIGGPPNPKNGIDHIDPTLNLTREDYRHMAAPKSGSDAPILEIEKGAPPIPKIADILAAPRPPKIGETQLVSIAVTDDVPLKDVLLELAKLADVDIELDSGISGGIEFIAKDKPFNEVIDRISELTGLRYTMKNGVLRVERDSPFIKSYSVDFLNVERDSDSAVNLSTNVLSTSVGGSGGGSALTTGSTSSVKSKTTGDFWKSLESSVQQVLAYRPADHVSDTTMQAETEASIIATAPPAATAPTSTGNTPGGGTPIPAPAPAAAKPKAAAPTPAASTPTSSSNTSNYTINRQAGVLTLNGTTKQHEMIERLLEALKNNAASQVLIEAKVIEVDLNDQYASGINWQTLGSKIGEQIGVGPISTSFPLVAPTNSIAQAGNFIQFTSKNDSSNILQLLEGFGVLRTLSSPRLHAINNQQSTLTFATNHVYFTISVTSSNTTTTNGSSTTNPPTYSSTINTVPIGIMMTMMPSIDLKNNEVTLSVRPTLSTLIDSVNDPAFELQLASAFTSNPGLKPNVHNAIPEIQVRELDSTLKLKSGQTMVIGGLMQQEANDTDVGVPFFAGLPIAGNLFKNVAKSSHNKELVLLIKATIVNTGGSLGKTDKTIFHKFSDDPRPTSF